MDDKAMILYLAAKRDKEFAKVMEDQDEVSPNADCEEWAKATYAAVYYGWLLGKGSWETFVKQQGELSDEFRANNIV